jgi:hypothetical protein
MRRRRPPRKQRRRWLVSNRVRHGLSVIAAIALTLILLHFVSDRLLTAAILPAVWAAIFFPVTTSEFVMFAVATVFFLIQNYATLRAGVFEFRFKDILLMPYYEPFLWGFYFIAAKRFIAGRADEPVAFEWKAVVGLAVTSVVFSVFAFDNRTLLLASLVSTGVLVAMFHTARDVYYAIFLLVLGFVVELYGVSTGLWRYPASDFLGIPYWFATMWVSAGLLGRRFLLPIAQSTARRLGR